MTQTWTALSWPNHQIGLEEWEALPDDGEFRLELVEGMLQVSAKPLSWHQKAGMRIGYRVDEQLPQTLTTVLDVDVVVFERPLTIRSPDVIVIRSVVYATNPPRYSASDVLVAVEILSDGTRRVDRIMKFSEYADAGIPQYWIVDLGSPTTLLAYVLVAGHYELSAEHTGSVTLDVAGHPVTLDLDALTTR